MIRIARPLTGPQLFVGPLRIHHFHFGMAALALGAYLIATDRRDFLNWVLYGRKLG